MNERILHARGDYVQTFEIRGRELYFGEVEGMADAVLRGKAPRVSLEDSRGNVAAIGVLLRSARAGEPVSLT